MRIAVTGSRGFIGRACVLRAKELGHEVVEFDRQLGSDVLEQLTDLAGCDAVIHLAGVLGTAELYANAERAIDVNIKGTLNVLRVCADHGTAYVGITMPSVWANIYQATKLAAQTIALGFHRDFGVPVTHIRAFNAYGPGQAYGRGHPQKIVPTFARALIEGRPVPIWGSGAQTVDLVYVDHVARCLVDAALAGTAYGLSAYGDGQVYDASSGRSMSVLDVARRTAEALDTNLHVEFLPMRKGETPDTKLCGHTPPPSVGFDHFTRDRFSQVVRSYRSSD